MSTRSAIGTIDNSTGESRLAFHHWDGYPSGVGQTLWGMYHGTETNSERFKGNLSAMLDVLLAHTWSSINGHDWSFDPGYLDHNSALNQCRDCHTPPRVRNWTHRMPP